MNWSSGRRYKYRYQGVGKMALQNHDHGYETGPRVSCISAGVSGRVEGSLLKQILPGEWEGEHKR